MIRQACLAAVAGCLVLVTACGSETGKAPGSPTASPSASPTASASASATPAPTPAGDAAALTALLPTTKQLEYLLGYPLEQEIRADLTQFHEGATVEATAGQVGFFRPPGSVGTQPVDAGGYIALSLFATDAEASRFLDTNPNYDEDREPNPGKGFLEVFELSEVSDDGTGYVYRESGDQPAEHTQGIARIGRYVIEVTLFHGAGQNLIPATRQIVDDFRARLPQGPKGSATPGPTPV